MDNRTKLFTIQVLALVLLLSISKASAETIVLKSGKKVVGKIIEQTDSYVVAEVVGIPTTYYRDEIEGIEEGDAGGVATGQRDSIDKQAAAGDIKSNPEYEAIFATIKNFFENRNNPEEALKSVSKKFHSTRRDGTEVNYDQFRKTLAGKSRQATTIESFQLIELNMNGNNADAKIKFIQKVQNEADGTTKEIKIKRGVLLEKEKGVWEIAGINNHPDRGEIEMLSE